MPIDPQLSNGRASIHNQPYLTAQPSAVSPMLHTLGLSQAECLLGSHVDGPLVVHPNMLDVA